jgi:hypothetical protein
LVLVTGGLFRHSIGQARPGRLYLHDTFGRRPAKRLPPPHARIV